MNKEVTIKIPKEDFDKAVKSGVEQAMKECELTIGMTLKEAVEKQIPKKPSKKPLDIRTPVVTWGLCPVCEGELNKLGSQPHIVFKNQTYCMDCGQRLKWGD